MAQAAHIDQAAFHLLEVISRDLSRRPLAIPTFVDASLGVRMALARKELSTAELARVVSGEPLLSARVVALANSVAMNPGGRQITDVRSAVTRIGQNAVRNISAALALEQVSHASELAPFRVQAQAIWAHSLEVAVNAKVLAHRLGRVNPEEAMFAGLVHDLGHLYLMGRVAATPELAQHPESLDALADEWHPGVGAALLQSMDLSEAIARAVDEHELDPAILPVGSLSQLLSVANRCARRPPEAEASAAAAADPALPDGAVDEHSARAVLAESGHAISALLTALRG
jgi:putative nucleotidyltransferase with HDIG domain